MAVRSFGQYGNRYTQRNGFANEFEGFDQGKYSGLVNLCSQTNGQGYNLGWNGYQERNVFNPYQKLGYYGYRNQGFSGGLGFVDSGQLFGVQQPTNVIGNQRFRV